MKQARFSKGPGDRLHDRASPSASTGRQAISVAPPLYGIGFVDGELRESALARVPAPPSSLQWSGNTYKRETGQVANRVMRAAEPAPIGSALAAAIQRKCTPELPGINAASSSLHAPCACHSPCGCSDKELLKTSPVPGGHAELDEEGQLESPREEPARGTPCAAKAPALESWVVTARKPRSPKSAEAPLESWVVGGAATAGTNTIKCDGSGGIAVQTEGTGNAATTACLGDCIRRHEESHRSDALAANADICNGATAGNIVTVNTHAERKDTEVRASNVEINCLKAKPDSDACRNIIAARITQMEQYRDSF